MVMYHGFHKNMKQISNTTVYNIDNINNNKCFLISKSAY